MAYPITEKTNLSISKTAKLLQTLVDLAGEGGGQKLPEKIQKCVDNVLKAQKNLVKVIDGYMHSHKRGVDEVEVVSSIIETCPEFLATKSNGPCKSLPIVYLVNSKNEETAKKYVPLLAEVGRKHGIGGEEGRGGLVVENANGWNALQYLARRKSIEVMEVLKNANPPLLLKDDVHNYRLISKAVVNESFEMIKYMVKLDPSCLYYNHSQYGIPLAQVCRPEVNEEKKKHHLEIAKYLLREAVSYDASNDTIGGLFAKRRRSGQFTLDSMVEKYGADDTWSCIRQALSSFPDLPILHQVIQHSPQNFQNATAKFPKSALLRDSKNRLPIHIALECGMEWGPDLVSIMNINNDHLKDVDPVTKWPPFVLAALDESKSCDLSTVFYLFRENPQHVQVFLNGRKKKKKKCRSVDTNVDVTVAPKRKKTKYHLRQRH